MSDFCLFSATSDAKQSRQPRLDQLQMALINPCSRPNRPFFHHFYSIFLVSMQLKLPIGMELSGLSARVTGFGNHDRGVSAVAAECRQESRAGVGVAQRLD
jgi:hypothetical protein